MGALSNLNKGDVIEFGNFRRNNIEWIVLDKKENSILIISKYLLESMEYYSKEGHLTFGNITWEVSKIREWLNGEFLTNTFSEDEKSRILTTKIQNNEKTELGFPAGRDTRDKVFLLSWDEAKKYFPSDKERTALDIDSRKEECWWLRSTVMHNNYAARVFYLGQLGEKDGDSFDHRNSVLPAMWIDGSNLQSKKLNASGQSCLEQKNKHVKKVTSTENISGFKLSDDLDILLDNARTKYAFGEEFDKDLFCRLLKETHMYFLKRNLEMLDIDLYAKWFAYSKLPVLQSDGVGKEFEVSTMIADAFATMLMTWGLIHREDDSMTVWAEINGDEVDLNYNFIDGDFSSFESARDKYGYFAMKDIGLLDD